MAKGSEWISEIKRMPQAEREEYLRAMNLLATWKMFQTEFEGFMALRSIVEEAAKNGN
jgi:hypothetical protein